MLSSPPISAMGVLNSRACRAAFAAFRGVVDTPGCGRAGAGVEFWEAMRQGLGGDEAFKEAVIRDNEIVALVAGLLATIAFAGLLAPMEACCAPVRLAYLAATFCAMGMSLSGTVIAVRTIVLVNSQPAADCLYLMEQVQQRRLWHKLNPFMLTHWSVTPLLFATCLLLLCAYGTAEFLLAALLSTAIVEYLFLENDLHHEVRMGAVGRRRAASQEK